MAATLTVEGARRLATAGEAEAMKRGWAVAMAIEDGVAAGRMGLLSLSGALLLEGGVPVVRDGLIVGAVGVSGMTSAEDGIIAAAAVAGG